MSKSKESGSKCSMPYLSMIGSIGRDTIIMSALPASNLLTLSHKLFVSIFSFNF